jgi:hypothetical protein
MSETDCETLLDSAFSQFSSFFSMFLNFSEQSSFFKMRLIPIKFATAGFGPEKSSSSSLGFGQTTADYKRD